MPLAFVLIGILSGASLQPAYFYTGSACWEARAWVIRMHGQAECFTTGAAGVRPATED